MREAKFRFWEPYRKVFFIFELGKNHCDDISIDIVKKYGGQYTGIKDKNGIEICEGDIIKLCDELQVVEWDDFGFSPWTVEAFLEERLGSQDLEIMGNIYENPGLIRGQ